MTKRLGVWSRLGIVLTLVWLIGGTLYLQSWQTARLDSSAELARAECERINQVLSRNEDCWSLWTGIQRERDWGAVWESSFLTATGLALFAWIIGGFAYWSIRWILAGRKRRTEQ